MLPVTSLPPKTAKNISQYETAVKQVKERTGSTSEAKNVAASLYRDGTISEADY